MALNNWSDLFGSLGNKLAQVKALATPEKPQATMDGVIDNDTDCNADYWHDISDDLGTANSAIVDIINALTGADADADFNLSNEIRVSSIGVGFGAPNTGYSPVEFHETVRFEEDVFLGGNMVFDSGLVVMDHLTVNDNLVLDLGTGLRGIDFEEKSIPSLLGTSFRPFYIDDADNVNIVSYNWTNCSEVGAHAGHIRFGVGSSGQARAAISRNGGMWLGEVPYATSGDWAEPDSLLHIKGVSSVITLETQAGNSGVDFVSNGGTARLRNNDLTGDQLRLTDDDDEDVVTLGRYFTIGSATKPGTLTIINGSGLNTLFGYSGNSMYIPARNGLNQGFVLRYSPADDPEGVFKIGYQMSNSYATPNQPYQMSLGFTETGGTYNESSLIINAKANAVGIHKSFEEMTDPGFIVGNGQVDFSVLHLDSTSQAIRFGADKWIEMVDGSLITKEASSYSNFLAVSVGSHILPVHVTGENSTDAMDIALGLSSVTDAANGAVVLVRTNDAKMMLFMADTEANVWHYMTSTGSTTIA